MIAKRAAVAAIAALITASAASANVHAPRGFDLDGGKCDWQGAYAYFNHEGMVEVESGSKYVGGGYYYIPDPEAVTATRSGLIRYQVLSEDTGEAAVWLVHPEGYITQSEAYDANTIRTEGAVDVLKLTPCG